MKEEFIINFSSEQGDYLQRLGTEVDAKAYVIDYMLTNHMNDDNTLLFESVPFKHYEKQYEEAMIAFNLAKQEFDRDYLKPQILEKYGKDVGYTWQIDDYTSKECKVTIL